MDAIFQFRNVELCVLAVALACYLWTGTANDDDGATGIATVFISFFVSPWSRVVGVFARKSEWSLCTQR